MKILVYLWFCFFSLLSLSSNRDLDATQVIWSLYSARLLYFCYLLLSFPFSFSLFVLKYLSIVLLHVYLFLKNIISHRVLFTMPVNIMSVRFLPCSSSSRRAHHIIFKSQNYIEPRGNILKGQTILDINQCYLNINYVKHFFLVQAVKYLIWTNKHKTKDLKNGSCYKK